MKMTKNPADISVKDFLPVTLPNGAVDGKHKGFYNDLVLAQYDAQDLLDNAKQLVHTIDTLYQRYCDITGVTSE